MFEQTIEVVEAINSLFNGDLSRGFGVFCVDNVVMSAQVNALNDLTKDAARIARGRRGLVPTGAEAARRLTKAEVVDRYSVKFKGHTQVEMIADLLDEPAHNRVVRLLEVLPPDLAARYRYENNIVSWAGKSEVVMREIEDNYGFVGGSQHEYIHYFHRGNMSDTLWSWIPFAEAKAVAGMAAVLKKDGHSQRKLLMACAANYVWHDISRSNEIGLSGAAALCSIHTKSHSVEVATLDESSAFTSIETPEWMWPWFTVPPLKA